MFAETNAMADLFIQLAETDEDRAACLAIRHEVFVEEQHVPAELEWDEHDAGALHLLARDANAALGSARLVDYGDGIVKIGRVCVLASARGLGIGAAIMEFALDEARRRGFREAQLSAQVTVVEFYERLGYESFGGEDFFDAGILHRMMRRGVA